MIKCYVNNKKVEMNEEEFINKYPNAKISEVEDYDGQDEEGNDIIRIIRVLEVKI